MSRCFPFPPPGYEAKPRSEEQRKDLLKKVKHREKKNIEEKDSRKRERKGKDRDHKKDKHNKKCEREKRQERSKNNDRYRDKNQTRQETSKSYNYGNRKPKESRQYEPVKDIKQTNELATQFFCEESDTNHKHNNTRELLPWSTDRIGSTGSKEKERKSLSRMVQKSAQAPQDNHGMVQKRERISHANRKGMDRGVDSKTKIKDGKSLHDGSAEMHSKRRHNCNGVGLQHDNSDTQRSSEGIHTASSVVSDSAKEADDRTTPSPNALQRAEQMRQNPDICIHSAKVKNDSVSTKAMMKRKKRSADNFPGKMNQQFARNEDGAVEGKAKNKYCMGVEGKDRDSVIKKRKNERKNKEKEVENNGTVYEQKLEDLGILASKDNVNNFMRLGFLNKQRFAYDDLKRRKDFGTNSCPRVDSLVSPSFFLFPECSMRTSKLPRMSPTNLTCVKEEMSQHPQGITPCYSSSELVGANTCDIGQHERQDNYNNGTTGSLEEHAPSVSSSGYESSTGYLKQPHPDSKYLSQVHSIPSTQDFSKYIDQDWLFSGDNIGQKTGTFEAAESRQVWSDAQLIETADVIALPYVVPL